MLKPAAALAIFLILTMPFAASEVPQLSSSLSAEISEQGTITAVGGEIRSLALNLSIPSSAPSAPYQVVDAGEPMQFDADGNAYLAISSQGTTRRFTYSKKISVQSVARSTPTLPRSYSVPSQYSSYLLATSRTQSDDDGMRKLAQQVTSGAQTPFEKVALLAIYVNKNMRYESAMVGQEKDALWVKQNMYGVCTEYSTLFIALARSIGIPARYATGYVYSDVFKSWMGHAWAEAYIGQWVPVDPTWFEVGALDAMHIEESKSAEFIERNTVSATVSSDGVRLEWDTGAKSGAFAGNIKTQGIEYSGRSDAFQFSAVDYNLSSGSSTIAYLAMNGTDYRVVPLSLAGCTGGKTIMLDEGEKYLILQPGKLSVVAWQLNASSSLQPGYIYSCPLTLNSPYLSHRTLTIGVNPAAQPLPDFTASLASDSVAPGKGNSVLLRLPWQRQGETFTVVLPDGVHSAKAGSAAAEIPFSSQAAGSVLAYVAGSRGGSAVLGYSSGGNASTVSIDSFALPDVLVAGSASSAQANLSAKSYPLDVMVEFIFAGEAQQAVGRLEGPSSFSFNFTPSSPGAASARVSASSSGSQSSSNRVASVLMRPALSVDKVESLYINGTLYTRITFLPAGDPASPTATVEGASYSAASPLVVRLPLGKQELRLAWSDAAGNSYSSVEKITVSQPSLSNALTSGVRSAGGCPLALIFLSVAIVPFIFKR